MSIHSMNTQTLKNLTKDQLIELILKQKGERFEIR